MKPRNLFNLCFGLLASVALLTGCSDSDSYDIKGSKGNLAFFEAPALSNPYVQPIYSTPAGVIGGVGKPMKVFFQRPVGKNTTVSVKANAEAAQKFLDDNGMDDYFIIPEDFFDYSMAQATVLSGNSESTDEIFVMVKNDKVETLREMEGTPFAAFTIDEVSGDGESSTSRNTYYAIVNDIIVDDLHFVSEDTENFGITFTPVGNFGSVEIDRPFEFAGTLTQDVEITLTQDNSLLEDGELPLPSGALVIENNIVTASAGESVSDENIEIYIPEEKFTMLEPNKTYIVPFRISISREDGVSIEDAGEYYMVITTSERISRDRATSADMVGSPISADAMASWTVTASQGSANISNVINQDDNVWSRNRTYTIDLKQEYKVSGLQIYCYYAPYGSYYCANNIKLELSTDGTNWIDCGTVTNLPLDNTFQYYALYGGVPARYIRMYFGGSNYYVYLDQLRVYAQ